MGTQRTQQFQSYIHGVAKEVVDLITDKQAFIRTLPQGHSEEDGLAENTKLLHRVQELVSSYVCVEQKYMQESVETAIAKDDLDPYEPDTMTTTLVDDTF